MGTSFILRNSFWNTVQTDFWTWCSSHRPPVFEMCLSWLWKNCVACSWNVSGYKTWTEQERNFSITCPILIEKLRKMMKNDIEKNVSFLWNQHIHRIIRIIRIEIRFLTSSISAHELNLAPRKIMHLINGCECSCICATVSKIILQSFTSSGFKTDPVYSRIATATYSLMNRR